MSRARQVFQNPQRTTKNAEGIRAYERSLPERYLQMLLTNTFGNTFYSDAQKLADEARKLHMEMLDTDPLFMAKAIVFARNEGYMRLQPIYGLSILAGIETTHSDLFAQAFKGVIRIPSDFADFLSILEGEGRGQGGRRVKRVGARFLQENVTEYWGLKYGGRGRGYSLGDIIATMHPRPQHKQQSVLFQYLTGKMDNDSTAHLTLSAADLHQLAAFESLKKTDNDDEIIELIHEGKLPYEVVTGALPQMSPKVWKHLLRQMPLFAALRHLNTFDRNGLLSDPEVLAYLRERFADKEALQKSKILPFRFLTAFNAISNNQVRDYLRSAVELTFANLPDISGRTAVLLDKSGSMQGKAGKQDVSRINIGSVFAYALYKKTGGNGLLWAFDTQVYDMQPSLHDSILMQAERVQASNGTNCAAPLLAMIERKERVDNIIMITDEQENAWNPRGHRMFEALQTYRKTVNPEAKAFIINIAPEEGSLTPIQDKNTFYLYGWSDSVLQYIEATIKGFGGLIDAVKSTAL